MEAIDDSKDSAPASPFVYLGRDPTPEEHQLAQQVGLHDGASTPFHMLAKIAVRLHRYSTSAAGFEWFWRRARRHARTALGALAANALLIGGFVVHRVADDAAAREHTAAQERAEIVYREGIEKQLDKLDKDIRELRAALQRLGVNLPQPTPSSGDRTVPGQPPDPDPEDKVSFSAPWIADPASVVGSGGRGICEQTPPLQNRQEPKDVLHWMLELQVVPHSVFGATVSGAPQPARQMARSKLRIQELYPGSVLP